MRTIREFLAVAIMALPLAACQPAVAQNLTARPYAGMALSAALAVTLVWTGLALAFYLPYPASFFITALAFVTYLMSVLYTRLVPAYSQGQRDYASLLNGRGGIKGHPPIVL